MDDNQLGASSPEEGLTVAVTEIERSAAQLGWDRASTVYALVPTGELLELDELPADMRNQLESTWDHSPHTLTAVIQEDLPGTDLEENPRPTRLARIRFGGRRVHRAGNGAT